MRLLTCRRWPFAVSGPSAAAGRSACIPSLNLLQQLLPGWSSSHTLHLSAFAPRDGPGTPRHVVMACAAMAPLVDLLRDALEADLSQHVATDALLQAAADWRGSLPRDRVPSPPPLASQNRWPLLSAWRWLVPIPDRESLLSVDVNGSSAVSTSRETGSDLAYRGVLPLQLGVALCRSGSSDSSSADCADMESFATLAQPAALASELDRLAQSQHRFLPAIRTVQALLLGLRRIRAEYQRRIEAWLRLACAATPVPAPLLDAAAPRQVDPLLVWLYSPPGSAVLRELRWSLLSLPSAASRVRLASGFRSRTESAIKSLLFEAGVALLVDGLPSWGPDWPSWDEALSGLSRPCLCPASGQSRLIVSCWACGGPDFPRHSGAVQPCPWCMSRLGDPCASCHTVLHCRGRCRWNSGAHAAYVSQAPGVPTLCPDCWWEWVKQLASNPRWRRRPIPLSEPLHAHLRLAASQCCPGAGSQQGPLPLPGLRRVRRWLLTNIRHSGGSDMAQLLSLFCSQFPAAEATCCSTLLRRASQALQAEGLAVYIDPHLVPLRAA